LRDSDSERAASDTVFAPANTSTIAASRGNNCGGTLGLGR
jgi:hypothetical protein